MILSDISTEIEKAKTHLGKQGVFSKINDLEAKTHASDFWDTPQEAQKISAELGQLNKLKNAWEHLEITMKNLEEMAEFLSEEELKKELENLEKELHQAKVDLFLSGKLDDHNAIVTLTVGAGGVDANDWTQMVLRMLLKYCENKNWKTEIIDTQDAETAGIKGATFRAFGGAQIYGHLKSENGTHRLVRPSPFNAKGTRETSFANVEVVPEVETNEEVRIDEKDLKIDTFRAQGAGGQHVNTTDSAVRITHIPSGIVVQCQNERSQHQNKDRAMKVLQSRLAEKIRQEQEAKQNALKSDKVHASFGGGHIRSYVLDDRYVKDTRTDLKSTQVEKILDGDLDNFIEAFITQQ